MTWRNNIPCLLALTLLAPAAPAAAPAQTRPVVKLTPIQPVGPSPITPDCRYLLVVDTSAAMQRYADGLYRTTHRLVATGLGGRMRDGDIFTVWTYADTVLTREFPLNAWTPELNIGLANRAYEFLAQQKFHGKSNLRPVFAELGQALAIATNLTVIFVSDGTDVVVGTPFDRPINITYGKRASEMRSAKMPFVTSLVTRHGEFTHWSVRGGLEDIGLPFPEKPAVPAPLLVQAPVVVTPPAPPVVSPAKPVPTTNSPPKPTAPAPVPNTVTRSTKPLPPATTNTIAAKPPEPVVPKPAAPATPPVPAPAPKAAMKIEPAPAPVSVPSKPAPNLQPPTSIAKQEAKSALPPPPKPAVAPARVVPSTSPVPIPAAPPVAAKAKEPVVPQPLPPVIPPALRQPRSVMEASNALAKVELLRPPAAAATSAPPVKPLAARVVEPKPAPAPVTNAVPATRPIPSTPAIRTNPPVAKPATNSALTPLTAKPKPAPPVVPPAITQKAPASKPLEQKAAVPVTNTAARSVSSTSTPLPSTRPAEVRDAGKRIVLTNAPTAAKPVSGDVKKPVTPAAKAPVPAEKSTQPAGQLAVASPDARKGGWGYLAAAVALLILAGGIIAHLLRPRPQPSVISQSLDDKRV